MNTVTTTATVVLVDDHPMMTAGLAATLSSLEHLEIIAHCQTSKDATRVITTHKPNLVITDLNLPDTNGIELMRTVHTTLPKIQFCFLSFYEETIFAERTIRAGARGYLMKSTTPDEIRQAVQTILADHVYLSPRASAQIMDSLGSPANDAPLLDSLSERELDTLMAIGRGKATKEIAADFGISIKTVETHRQRIKKKLGLGDTTALMKYAIELHNWA